MATAREVLVGIDVGTTNVKVVAYDRSGVVQAGTTSPLPVYTPRPDWTEYNPQVLWQTTARALQKTVSDLGAGCRVLGVAVASMAETAVPLGPHGEALYNAVAWHDPRTLEQLNWWQREVGAETTYRITGLPLLPIFGVLKLLWLRQHHPELYRRTRVWLNVADYVAYRLCGVQATDLSLASRVMLLDLERQVWSAELLAACELPGELLAELVPSGTPLGEVHAEGSIATGLPKGTPVVAGGHDHPCGAVALGLTRAGDVFDSMGTSEAMLAVLERPRLDPAFAATGYQQGVHVAPGRTYVGGGLVTSGASVAWLRALLGVQNDDAFAALLEEAERVAPGSGGVFFLPHLRMASPPVVDPHSRGAFVGLTANTDRARLLRAVLEGLAFEAQGTLNGLVSRFDVTPGPLRVIGWGQRLPLLVRIKAALWGGPVALYKVDEAVTRGAALLAGVGAGVYADLAAAAKQVGEEPTLVTADASWQTFYGAAYSGVYTHLYEHLAPLSAAGANFDANPDAASAYASAR